MAKLRNFTLDGDALRVVAYTDQHGVQRFNVEILQEFQDKALTMDQFLRFVENLSGDVCEWDAPFHMAATGEMTNGLISGFLKGGAPDGVQLCDVLQD
jgi:hypothetical protein